MHPLTPPDDGDYAQQQVASSTARLPPILHGHYHQSPMAEPTSMPVDDPFISAQHGLASKHQLYEIPPPPVSAPMDSESHSHQQRRHSSHMQNEFRRESEQLQVEPVHHHPTPAASGCVWDSAPHRIDWLDFTRNRSAHFIAEKTCEMICYLWFASSPVTRRPTPAPPSRDDDGIAGNGLGRMGGERSVMDGGDASMSYPSPNHSPSSPSRMANSGLGETSSLLSVPSHNSSSSKSLTASPTRSPPSTLQLVATPSFISFMQKLLETTQVSQSVIVLSLHYIYRLKERNHFTPAQRGSEFRIAVAGLMMANKFLDDNTYTNKTWSEVSGIELAEINRMEREFLLGVDFNLYVDKPTYESWLNLLKGLVQAKERDARNSRDIASRRRDARDSRKVPSARYHHHSTPRTTRNPQPQSAQYQPPAVSSPPQQRPAYSTNTSTSAGQIAESDAVSSYATPTRLPPLSRAVPSAYYYPYTSSNTQHPSTLSSATQSSYPVSQPHASHHGYSRARSTSPTAEFSASNGDVRMSDAPEATVTPSTYANAPVSHKRTAEAAFSPTSASFGAHLPSKRPTSMILTIPDSSFSSGMGGSAGATTGSSSGVISAASAYENSPLDTLSGFSSMTLEGSPQKRQQQQDQTQYHQPQPQPAHHHQPLVPSTLVAPYSYQVDSRKGGSQPQELYFYTLASSPMEPPMPTRSRASGRKSTTPMEVPIADADEAMDDDEDVVESTAEEWERSQRERDAHGERRRTRKARLMRWSTSSSSASSAAPFDNGSSGGYAYDYSKTWSAYRQHQQAQQQQPSAPTTSYTSNTASAPAHQGYQYSQAQDTTAANSSGAAIPSLVHPVPRPFISVVQSAHTSPSSGVVYVPRTGEVGYANGYLSQQHQQPPPSAYQSSAPEATKTFESHQYAPPTHQQSQPQPSKAYEYPPMREQPQRQSVHHYRSQSRGHSQPWYTQNQGGSVSYHPSPVQEKRDYVEYNRTPHRYAGEPPVSYVAPPHVSGHAAVNLPHFHDNVWSKPPVVLAQRECEQQQVDRPSYGGVVEVEVIPVSRSRSRSVSCGSETASEDGEDVIPSAPFANAGPAGVAVPFGSEYARYQGHHQELYQPQVHQSSSLAYSTVPQHQQYHHSGPQRGHVQPAAGNAYTYVYAQHPTSKYGDEQQWSTRGRGEY
ncbi:hypothetical protein H1R20_g18, partial [Candolleomyces eurysporus]